MLYLKYFSTLARTSSIESQELVSPFASICANESGVGYFFKKNIYLFVLFDLLAFSEFISSAMEGVHDAAFGRLPVSAAGNNSPDLRFDIARRSILFQHSVVQTSSVGLAEDAAECCSVCLRGSL